MLRYTIHDASQNYMIIESIAFKTVKTIHVLNFDRMRSIRVGRAPNAEVRITDISVSRHHSTFILTDAGKVAILDNNSKFGTLKLLRQPLKVPVKASSKQDDAIYL